MITEGETEKAEIQVRRQESEPGQKEQGKAGPGRMRTTWGQMYVGDSEEFKRENLHKSVWVLNSVHKQKSLGVKFIFKGS